MNNNIELLRQDILHYTEGGYISRENQEILYARGKSYGIPKSDIEAALGETISAIRNNLLKDIFVGIPNAALDEHPVYAKESPRAFPEVLNVGLLRMKINTTESLPACMPIANKTGVAVFFKGNEKREQACNIIQNITMRLLLSIPKDLCKVTMFDLRQYGMSFNKLAGLDTAVLKRQTDDKKYMAFLEEEFDKMSDFIFNRMGNMYASLGDYNMNVDPASQQPYHVIISSGLPMVAQSSSNTEKWDELLQYLSQILPIAYQSGRFFMIAVNTDEIPDSVCEVLKSHMNVLDITSSTPRMFVGRDLPLLETAYELDMTTRLVFDSQSCIFSLNHELDPQKYPIKPDKKRLSSIEDLKLSFDGKETAFRLGLKEGDNVFYFCNDKKIAVETLLRMVSYLNKSYGKEDVNYAFFNCNGLPELNQMEGVIADVRSNKVYYLQGFLEMLWAIQEERKAKFGNMNYGQYRNSTDESCPRILCFISGMEHWADSPDAFLVMMRLNDLLECSRYGIHFFIEGSVDENYVAINFQNNFNFLLLSKIDVDNLKSFEFNIIAEHALQSSRLSLFSVDDENLVDVSVKPLSSTEVDGLVNSLKADAKEAYKYPPLFVDMDDNRPRIYDSIKCVEDISDEDRRIPIGIPRFYQKGFYCLNLATANEGVKRVAVVGNEPEGLVSIMKSIKGWVDAKGETFQLYDASKNVFDSLALGVKPVSDLEQVQMVPGVVCLANMDSYPLAEMSKFHALMNRVLSSGTDLVLLARNDVFEKEEWKMATFDFAIKLRLQTNMEACDQDGNKLWLFKY